MRLVTGPAGSGKTTWVLDRFRDALRSGNDAVRLLVPTATLAQHLQNRVAREGLAFRHDLIQTLHSFVEDWAGDAKQCPDPVLYLIVEDAARRVNRPEFARVVAMPGFCAALARTIEEFSSAGCDSARLEGVLPDTPLGAAFVAVYREVDRELTRRGLALRSTRLRRAAAAIEEKGAGGIRDFWLDGFHALADPELAVIAALGNHAELSLTLSDPDAAGLRARLAAMGFEEQHQEGRRGPAMLLVRALGIEREAEEIARRILEQSAAGRPFREIGVVVRARESYVPILRTAFERFHIPARFYFDEELERHPVVRYLTGVVQAMLGGWKHDEVIAVLRLAPRFSGSNALDRLDFAAREQAPDAGLGVLKSLLVEEGRALSASEERLLHKLDSLAAIEEWRSFALRPADWARQCRGLRHLFRPSTLQPGDVEVWRSQAAALDAFDQALEETALALEGAREMRLDEFWRSLESVLRLKPLRLHDDRRDVVHVLSAPEARQWVLPVVFVCGMVERQFPQFHRQDPFFPDAARVRLHSTGVRIRTAAEFEREERALFDAAASRATMLTVFSLPEFDARGERNLPSLYLEDLLLPSESARAVRPRPPHPPAPASPAAIRNPSLLPKLRDKTARVSPSGLESFLQCPFQYFSGRLLRLKAAPPLPADRLDFMTQGSIVHDVLAQWYAAGGSIEAVFERVFDGWCEEKRIPVCYHTERNRNRMLEDLLAFAANTDWQRAGFQSRMEEGFLLPLDGIEVSGKIDRLDVDAEGRAYVIDYKYSAAQRTRDRLQSDTLLQAQLYLLAAQRVFGLRPAGMFYVGLKGKVVYAGWSEEGLLESEPPAAGWLEDAEARTLDIVGQIRGGRIEPEPKDRDLCRFCDYSDVCRVDTGAAAAMEEGA